MVRAMTQAQGEREAAKRGVVVTESTIFGFVIDGDGAHVVTVVRQAEDENWSFWRYECAEGCSDGPWCDSPETARQDGLRHVLDNRIQQLAAVTS